MCASSRGRRAQKGLWDRRIDVSCGKRAGRASRSGKVGMWLYVKSRWVSVLNACVGGVVSEVGSRMVVMRLWARIMRDSAGREVSGSTAVRDVKLLRSRLSVVIVGGRAMFAGMVEMRFSDDSSVWMFGKWARICVVCEW